MKDSSGMGSASASEGLSMTRRQLLRSVTAGAAAYAFGSSALAQAIAVQEEVAALSVGYLEGSELLDDVTVTPWGKNGAGADGLTVVPAERLPLGDQSLALGVVEMRLHGLYPALPPRRQAGFTAVVLTVLYPSLDPYDPDPFPYYAWQAKLWPGPNQSPPVRFLVPLRDDGGLELVIEVFDGLPAGVAQGAARVLRGGVRPVPAAGPVHRASLYTDFTVDWHDGRPKLQRGLYFLGLAPQLWRAPWAMRAAARGERPLHERASLVVSFDGVPEDDPPSEPRALDQVKTAS